jgi:hypothetical protein
LSNRKSKENWPWHGRTAFSGYDIEHRLNVVRRGRDDAQYFRACGLQLACLGQLAGEPSDVGILPGSGGTAMAANRGRLCGAFALPSYGVAL